MHIEFLVEDQSGKVMLECLVPKLLGEGHTFQIHAYKGIGRIPRGMTSAADANRRILLDQLPRLLAGYGRTFHGYGEDYRAAVVVVCDLDDRDLDTFINELREVALKASPRPQTEFGIAIEEVEAWFLGDRAALLAAYPKAKIAVLNSYKQDSICGTWELLADSIYPGGSGALKKQGFQGIGSEKSRWARAITLHMNPAVNVSLSFRQFAKILEDSIRST
jgi:hypothetical protein